MEKKVCPYATKEKHCVSEEERSDSIACQYISFCIKMASLESELSKKKFNKRICPYFEERIECDDR